MWWFVWMLACGSSEPDTARGPKGPQADQEDGFADSTSVRILAPSEGATVEGRTTLRLDLGEDVSFVQVRVDGELSGGLQDANAAITLDGLAAGRRIVAVEALGADRGVLSSDEVVIRSVDPSLDWVTIASPADGTTVVDPVQFTVSGSAGIDRIEVFADDWSLGDVGADGVLSYDFNLVDTLRTIEARGYDASGALIAQDTIQITPTDGYDPGPSPLNQAILDLIDTYPSNGTFTYYWPSTGSWSGGTEDLWYRDDLIGEGGYSACYCSGITWELYIRALQGLDPSATDDMNGRSHGDVMTMRRDWYVRYLDGPGPSVALENAGMGYEVVGFDNWQPGDFVQLWRTSGSGHTAVFQGWELDAAGSRIGMRYTSCQGSTDGFGTHVEYFGSFSGALDPTKMTAGRAFPRSAWY